MTDCEFLKSHLQKLQRDHDTWQKLTPHDFSWPPDPALQTSGEERCLRLADRHDFQFPELLYSSVDSLDPAGDWYCDIGRLLRRQIQMLPRIIAVIDGDG